MEEGVAISKGGVAVMLSGDSKELVGLVRDLGFPIFVAVWVLIVQKKSMDKLTEVIKMLTRAFDRANIHCTRDERGGE